MTHRNTACPPSLTTNNGTCLTVSCPPALDPIFTPQAARVPAAALPELPMPMHMCRCHCCSKNPISYQSNELADNPRATQDAQAQKISSLTIRDLLTTRCTEVARRHKVPTAFCDCNHLYSRRPEIGPDDPDSIAFQPRYPIRKVNRSDINISIEPKDA